MATRDRDIDGLVDRTNVNVSVVKTNVSNYSSGRRSFRLFAWVFLSLFISACVAVVVISRIDERKRLGLLANIPLGTQLKTIIDERGPPSRLTEYNGEWPWWGTPRSLPQGTKRVAAYSVGTKIGLVCLDAADQMIGFVQVDSD